MFKASKLKNLFRPSGRQTSKNIRRFDAASKGRRTENWRVVSDDPNHLIGNDLALMRARSRDLCRNNPWAKKARRTVVNNVVGIGFSARINTKHQAVSELWNRWSKSLSCDMYGRLNFAGIQHLAVSSMHMSGDVLIRRRRVKPKRDGDLPLKLEILEGDYLDETYTKKLDNGHSVVQGVELNTDGETVAYHLREFHPGSMTGWSNTLIRVPAEDIILLYDMERPGQRRGIPASHAAVISLHDFDKYEDATLLKQQIAASHAGYITDAAGDQADGLEADDKDDGYEVSDKIEAGTMNILPPGSTVTFSDPPNVTGEESFMRIVLRKIAAAFGISYESQTGDYSNVNYSSGRMGHIDMSKEFDRLQELVIIPVLCQRVWEWFAEAAVLLGIPADEADVEWTPPQREMLDPLAETKALAADVRSGFRSHSDALRSRGYDPIEVYKEIAKENRIFDKLGLSFDTDPRKITQSGQAQSESADEEEKQRSQKK